MRSQLFRNKLLQNFAVCDLMLRDLLLNGTGSDSLCEGCDATLTMLDNSMSGRRPGMEWAKTRLINHVLQSVAYWCCPLPKPPCDAAAHSGPHISSVQGGEEH